MPPKIIILGYAEASLYVQRERVDAVIAIAGSREFTVEADVEHRIDLSFDDAPSQLTADPLADFRARQRQRQAEEIGLNLQPPTINDAQRILDFADEIQEFDGRLLCHCQGGVSRSPAAALLCLAHWSSPGEEDGCVRALRAMRPSAVPHIGLVTFGDQLLGRNGRLVEAVESHSA